MSFIADHALWIDSDGKEGTRLHLTNNQQGVKCFRGEQLKRAFFQTDFLNNCDFTGAFLNFAEFRCRSMSGSSFDGISGVCLIVRGRANNTTWKSAYLRDASFRGVDLKGASFLGANLLMANFTGAKLDGADFRHANLSGAIGDGRYIKTLTLDPLFTVTYTADTMHIGCQSHTLDKWEKFTKADIASMVVEDDYYLEGWEKHRDFIFNCIDKYPAEPFKRA